MHQVANEFYREILKKYPLIRSDEIKVFDDGWDYLVCVVEEKHVFRFPRREGYAKQLQCEIAFLDEFSSLSSIDIPHMKISQSEDSFSYAEYDFIKGAPFEFNLVNKISANELLAIAKQLGTFLTNLHSFPIEKAKELGFLEANILQMWQENLEKAQKMVYSLLTKTEQAWIENLYQQFFNVINISKITKRLNHGDIMPRHIIIDSNPHYHISGIIDFGDMLIADSAFDFTYLHKYSNDFLDEVYANYTLERDDHFEKRRQFYEMRIPISELEHAVALKQKEEILRCTTNLKECMRVNDYPSI